MSDSPDNAEKSQPETPAEALATPDAEALPPPRPAGERADPGKTPSARTPAVSGARFDPASVIWTALWGAVLALGIAAGATTWERIERRAADRALLLLPSTESSETDREQWLDHLLEDLGFESGEWLSPKSLVQQVSAKVPPGMWGELFSESDAWLPWLLQLQPGEPLEDVAAFRAQIEKLRGDPRFRLVLYDEAALQDDADRYQRIRRTTFAMAGAMMLIGLIALLCSPDRANWKFDVPLGALLGAGLTALGWYGLNRTGLNIDREQGVRALATALGLAALFGPMLKGRITYYPRGRGE